MNGTSLKFAASILFAILCGAQATLGQSAEFSASQKQDQAFLAVPPPLSSADMKPSPPTPIALQKAELGKPGWDPAWDVVIEQALPAEFLTSKKVAHDVRPLCPQYASMSDADKRSFWAYFFQALAGAEAGLIPTISVRHTQPEVAIKDPVTQRMVRSEGLLQLAYMDADRYDCAFDWDADKALAAKDPAKTILQPKNNLLCGVKILDNQMIKRGKPLLTKKSYWSTLQPGTVSYRVFQKQMTNTPQACRAQRKPHRQQLEDEAQDTGDFPATEPASRTAISTFH
jgi:hypothetical protein